MQTETILNVFPGASDQQRLVLARCTTLCGLEHLVLRQETHSADIGWFVQSSVAIEPAQVAGLKMTLSPASVTGTTRRETADPDAPAILRFEQAS
ncbi:hypothetical protein LF1_43260 [Rubripirellula obstinata]|uniref:Uncharacterized protein n=1 Tax=Rubripirellula obstinata TaxID=406547 RepID=A0A5B1CMJ2_9BACT|nr:hypothetical protein [Rubripirellula obstinata]KAA1261766.1 hypothetical protein LF1_43260 [Rubripirellula obstinata]